MINSFLFSQNEIKFIARAYKKYKVADVCQRLNKRFNSDYKVSQVRSIICRGKFQSGRTGRFENGHSGLAVKGGRKPNTGTFKKGHNSNRKHDEGTEWLSPKGHVYVKQGDEWLAKHRILWVKHNGPLPEGYKVRFISGKGCDIDNLFLVSCAENLQLNRLQYSAQPEALKESTLLIAKIIAKTHALGKV